MGYVMLYLKANQNLHVRLLRAHVGTNALEACRFGGNANVGLILVAA